MDFDLKNAIDESFGGGPDHRPMEDRLRAGRRAVRRRRAVVSGVVAAAMAGIVGAASAVTGAGTAQRELHPASNDADTITACADATPGLGHQEAVPLVGHAHRAGPGGGRRARHRGAALRRREALGRLPDRLHRPPRGRRRRHRLRDGPGHGPGRRADGRVRLQRRLGLPRAGHGDRAGGLRHRLVLDDGAPPRAGGPRRGGPPQRRAPQHRGEQGFLRVRVRRTRGRPPAGHEGRRHPGPRRVPPAAPVLRRRRQPHRRGDGRRRDPDPRRTPGLRAPRAHRDAVRLRGAPRGAGDRRRACGRDTRRRPEARPHRQGPAPGRLHPEGRPGRRRDPGGPARGEPGTRPPTPRSRCCSARTARPGPAACCPPTSCTTPTQPSAPSP